VLVNDIRVCHKMKAPHDIIFPGSTRDESTLYCRVTRGLLSTAERGKKRFVLKVAVASGVGYQEDFTDIAAFLHKAMCGWRLG
jgi:hypothetical protein